MPFPNGSSTMTFELMTWPVWYSDRPSSSSGRALSRNASMRDWPCADGIRAGFTPRVVDLPGDALPELPAELELQRVVVLERAVGDELRGVDAGIRQKRGVGARDPVRDVEVCEARRLVLLDRGSDGRVRRVRIAAARSAAGCPGRCRPDRTRRWRPARGTLLPRAREVLQERPAHRADRVHLVQIDAAEDVPAEGADVPRLDRHVPHDLAGDAGADLMDVRLLDALVHAADRARRRSAPADRPACGWT